MRAEVGLKATAQYELSPGFLLSGAVTKSFWGNIGSGEVAPSNLPRVRSEASIYARDGDPAIEHLTAAWYARPGENLYSRVTAGYLEKMFGGVSAEVLWKPVDSRLALGAEVAYVYKRDYNQLFGFQDYNVATGHVSAYYDVATGLTPKFTLAAIWRATGAQHWKWTACSTTAGGSVPTPPLPPPRRKISGKGLLTKESRSQCRWNGRWASRRAVPV